MQSPMVSKGYRLKSSTHQLIRKVQMMLSCTQEGVIGRAVQIYYTEITKEKTPGYPNKLFRKLKENHNDK